MSTLRLPKLLLLVPTVAVWTLAALVAALLPHTALAAQITVDGTTCTLPAAIAAANADAPVGGCGAGSGADTLVLTAPSYALGYNAGFDADGPNATPSVGSRIVIRGGGAVVARTGAEDARLFHVAATGDLTLRDVTLQNGHVAAGTCGGAVYNAGTLAVVGSTLTGNTANCGGGFYSRGIAHVVGGTIHSNTAAEGGGGFAIAPYTTATLSGTQIRGNAAATGGGFDVGFGATVALTATHTFSNTAATGGGFAGTGILTLVDSEIWGNTATQDGGGFYLRRFGGATLTATQVYSNTAANMGGGFFSIGSTHLINSAVVANTAAGGGGGFFNSFYSSATLVGSSVRANSTLGDGGGFFAEEMTTIHLADTEIAANTAGHNGGGFYNRDEIAVANTRIFSNTAANDGGGFFNDGDLDGGVYPALTELANSELRDNRALHDGGGFANNVDGITTLTDTAILSNSAAFRGGGLLNLGTATLTRVHLLNNTGGTTGAALLQASGTTTLHQSCIVNNQDPAVSYGTGPNVAASDNWWGKADGPAGAGPGTGDSVSTNVDFTPFLTMPPPGCPTRNNALGLVLAIHAKPLHVLVGEPVTYTYHIANRGPNTFANLGVVDDRLGKVVGLSRRLVPGAEDTTALAYGTQTQDVGKLENVVTLTGNDTYGRPVTRQVRVVVTVTARLFLPHLPR